MKVEIEESEECHYEYPKLMRADDGLIVFFKCETDGYVVHAVGNHNLGAWSSVWDPSAFKDFKGKVILQND